MATTTEDDVPPETVTVGDRFGNVWEEVRSVPDRVASVVYAAPRRSLWPLVLIGVVFTALMFPSPVATAVGAIAMMLLTVWVVTHGG